MSVINYTVVLESEYPDCNWSIDNNDYSTIQWDLSNLKPKPTKEELDSKWEFVLNETRLQNCKQKAKNLITISDWSVLSDVNIQNKKEFENYRSILRQFIINPIVDPVFPVEPEPIWI